MALEYSRLFFTQDAPVLNNPVTINHKDYIPNRVVYAWGEVGLTGNRYVIPADGDFQVDEDDVDFFLNYPDGTFDSLSLSPSSLPNGQEGVAYDQSVTASGGTAPYTYTVIEGELPAGLTLTPATGQIAGTPTAAGSETFTIQAQDATDFEVTREYTLVIDPA